MRCALSANAVGSDAGAGLDSKSMALALRGNAFVKHRKGQETRHRYCHLAFKVRDGGMKSIQSTTAGKAYVRDGICWSDGDRQTLIQVAMDLYQKWRCMHGVGKDWPHLSNMIAIRGIDVTASQTSPKQKENSPT